MALVVRRQDWFWAPLMAASLALAATVFGWHGVDLPASLYRVGLFHRDGLTLWDSQWYGGHWTLNYSVIFPPVAGIVGIPLTEMASAGIAAWMFHRLTLRRFGSSARIGALLFALGTLAQVAIGQLPFLLGESLALCAVWAASLGRWRLAGTLAVATSLASPLAGAFLALGGLSWLLATWPHGRRQLAVVLGAAGAPVLALALLFPGQGPMPFSGFNFFCLLLLTATVAVAIPSEQRTLRVGAGLYALAILASFAFSTPVGENISRLAECVGAPLVLCVLWPRRRLLATALAIPLAALQWGPALSSFAPGHSDLSANAAYFQPLIGFLDRHAQPAGRLEVVPTKQHWEVAYVAPHIPLARGWERQLDTANNPLFYTQGELNAASYRGWLIDNGVRYIALPDVALDFAGTGEAQLLRAGLPGVRLAWHDAHWRVYQVAGAPGIVTGPAQLSSLDGSRVDLNVTAPGPILLRVRYSQRWGVLEGNGCLAAGPGGWTTVTARQPGVLRLALGLVEGQGNGQGC